MPSLLLFPLNLLLFRRRLRGSLDGGTRRLLGSACLSSETGRGSRAIIGWQQFKIICIGSLKSFGLGLGLRIDERLLLEPQDSDF